MTHDVEEKERRFAGQIVSWLKKRVGTYEISRLVILATPRMLGVLRRTRARLPNGHLRGIEGNLMRLDAGMLAEHPMVRNLVRGTNEA